MSERVSRRRARILVAACLAAIGLLAAGRLLARPPVPWASIVVAAVGSFLAAGPIAWTVRATVSDARRERLGYLAAGLAILLVPFVLGVGLLTGMLLPWLDALVFGGVVGLAAAALLERTAVPPSLRGPVV